MLSALFGFLAACLGLGGMWIWRRECLDLLQGLIPISMFFSGILAIVIGISTLRGRPAPLLKKDNAKE